MGLNRYEKMADELSKDVAKWSIDDVETYLTFKMDGFDKDELPALPALIDRSIEIIKNFTTIGTELTMTRYNK